MSLIIICVPGLNTEIMMRAVLFQRAIALCNVCWDVLIIVKVCSTTGFKKYPSSVHHAANCKTLLQHFNYCQENLSRWYPHLFAFRFYQLFFGHYNIWGKKPICFYINTLYKPDACKYVKFNFKLWCQFQDIWSFQFIIDITFLMYVFTVLFVCLLIWYLMEWSILVI